ncbi:MAG: hypothetical protein IJU41_03655 [Clostridia bacterium]|nr:hypothetical protein [Clostridia bacterium]
MKDRVPTQVINGAIRMAQYDENGDLVGYIYLKRADEPSEAGTPYSKNAVLTDATATAIGLTPASNPTPNDAFAKIAERISGLSDKTYGRIAALEKNTLFPPTLFPTSGTFTAAASGRYRFTAVGAGGSGSKSYSYTDPISYTVPGGGGGGGAVAVCVKEMTAGEQISFTISNGAVTLAGVMTAGKGGDASSAKAGSTGGAGGTAVQLGSLPVELYNGTDGEGKKKVQHNVSQSEAGVGGNTTRDFAGQITYHYYAAERGDDGSINRNQYGGKGQFTYFDLGYGGSGGYGDAIQVTMPGVSGGNAGLVVEYLGA